MGYWNWEYYPRNKANTNKKKPSERKKFGQTFWGKEFLNSLKGIDYSNRLPRGSAYANNGSVLSSDIKGNIITAKVQGSQRTPYAVDIVIPTFTVEEKKKIIEILVSNPAWMAELLNKKLPEDLLKETQKHKIRLFPSRWDDFKMKCSCPDSAVPCKHLAAVIYLLSYEIDLDPLMVLKVHGLDIIEEFKKQKIDIAKEAVEEIPTLSDAIIYVKNKEIPKNKIKEEKIFETCDYSKLPDTGTALLQPLDEATPFHNKSVKPELVSFIKLVSKKIKNIEFALGDDVKKNIAFCIDIHIKIPVKNESASVELVFEKQVYFVPINDFIRLVYNTNISDSKRWNYILQSLREFVFFCVKLVETVNIVPKMVTHNQQLRLMWFPLDNDAETEKLLSFFNEIIPSSVLHFLCDEDNKTGVLKEGDINLMSALFITGIIQNIQEYIYGKKTDSEQELNKLFCGNNNSFFNEKRVVNSIHIWLKKLHVSKTRFRPIIKIDDHYPEFKASLFINDSELVNEVPVSYKDFSESKKYEKEKMGVVKNLMLLAGYFKGISQLINNVKIKHLSYNQQEFTALLFDMVPCLKLLGVEVLLPKGLAKVGVPKISLSMNSKKGEKSGSFMSLNDMIDFDWQVAVGDSLIKPEEFFALIENFSGLVKIKDQYVMLTAADIEKLQKQLNKAALPDAHETIRILLSGEYEGAKVALGTEILELLKQWTKTEKEKLPKKLNAKLRPYQTRGFEWLYKNSQLGLGSILADDMGLGKTLQALTFILKMKEAETLVPGSCLIVAPTTLLNNWVREIEKFTPGLTHFIYHGLKRDSKEFDKYDVLLTSYGTLRSDHAVFEKKEWKYLLIDEAQNIKNSEAQQTKALKKIKAEIRIALSGTPVENRLGEYWSIMDFVNKGLLGNSTFFNKEFANPIQADHDSQKLEAFKKITAPFIMRRMKTDKSIISDLPEKVEMNKIASLTKAQAALYTSVVNECMQQIESSEGIARKGLVLKMMTALKQIGNHPAQYLKQNKIKADDSGKLSLLFDILEPIIENGDKTLLFTQYKEMGDILQRTLAEKYGSEPLFLHGSLNRKQRDEMVQSFQNFKHHQIFILSLKAGGTGLNLTAASNVVHFDLWWNPAVEAQATDRAYRIGQQKNVLVHRLINQGTLEERIDDMIQSKKHLANITVASGETWLGDLNNKELRELVGLSKH